MKYKIIAWLGIVILNTSWLHAQLKISTGGILYNNGAMMSLNDIAVTNQGSLTNASTSTIVYSGAKDDVLTSAGFTNFYGLTINKTGTAKVYLQTDIKVQGALTMSSGKLDLGSNNTELVYPSGLVMSETENNRILSSGMGEIYITQTLNNPFAVNPGNLGATITSAQNLGSTTIRRGHQVQSDVNGGQSIARYYKMTPADNSNLNASVQFKYLDAELNTIDESTLSLYAKPSTAWVLQGRDGADMAKNILQKNGISSFSLYTLGKGVIISNPPSLTSYNTAPAKHTAIGINTAEEEITAGPNPTTGDLKITLSRVSNPGKMNILVTDAGGRIVLQKQWQVSTGANMETIHINNQPQGVYIVKVFNSEGLSQTFTIIKR